MTDSGAPAQPLAASAWAAPGARGGSAGANPGPVLPPPTGPSRAGAAPPEAPPRPRTAWTPPPRRGLVPLRPIPFGAILGAPFPLQRRAPRTTLGPALLVSLVTTTLATLAGWAIVLGPEAALDAAYYDDYLVVQNLVGVAEGVAGWVPLVLALGANALLAGPVVVAASRSLLAERVSFRGMLWRLRGRAARLVAWALLVLAAGAVVLALAAVLPALVAVSSPAGGILSWLVALLEVPAVVLAGGYLAARLGFTAHVVALEGLRLPAAVRRSWTLSRRSGFRLLGQQLLVWCVVGLASLLLVLPVGWALDLGAGLVFPNGGEDEQLELYAAARTVVITAVTAVTGAFALVVQSASAALLYLDQRMRVEGLDLVLARYVDERQRGGALPDPFPAGGAA